MNELGVLIGVNENDNIAFYHIHTIKTLEQYKWNVGEILKTEDFSRLPSYNPPKRFREKAFEIVRQNNFPEMPSRTKCLFLSASLETTKEWYHCLGGDKQVLKIKLIEGKFVFLDEEIYSNEVFTDKGMKDDAYNYWDGDEYIDTKKISVLFEGIFRIEEEITL